MELLTSAVLCLALNIYSEARGEPTAGQYEVAQVVLNRKESWRFPNTICNVVYQPNQFSWTIKTYQLKDLKALDKAINIAKDVLATNDNTCVDHYHNFSVNPYWNRKMTYVYTIGNHKFYCSGNT